jgi:hypothetical protein
MGVILNVGRLPDWARDGAEGYLAGASDAGLTDAARGELVKAWEAASENDISFSFVALNDASLSAFLDYAAGLEGLKDGNEALERSRWRHLPYWLDSFWLPVRSDAICGEPTFFGSAHGLLANLAEIAAVSPHSLGTIPPYFEQMRADPDKFYFTPLEEPMDDKTALQWLWRAYYEAATVAVERNMVMWLY